MIKTLSKVRVEGAYLNIIEAIYGKPIANIIFNGQKLNVFPVRSGTRQVCLLSPLHTIQHSIGSCSTEIKQEKEIKGIQIGKEEVKLIVCR